ncbi:MAG: hypothetical protein WKF78_11825 [Candidatus Limnocylindrales bacterium]
MKSAPMGYGLVPVDPALPEGDRYLMALSAAVQASGLAERIGMAQTTRLIQDRMLDYFLSLRKRHGVVFQPIVNLSDGTLHEYECLFRPDMPMRPQSISAIVQAAIDTERSVELDAFLITTTLDRVGELVEGALSGSTRCFGWPSTPRRPACSIRASKRARSQPGFARRASSRTR